MDIAIFKFWELSVTLVAVIVIASTIQSLFERSHSKYVASHKSRNDILSGICLTFEKLMQSAVIVLIGLVLFNVYYYSALTLNWIEAYEPREINIKDI